MGWTDPRTWVTAETPTAALLNTHVRDNLRELWREIIPPVAGGGVSTPGNAGIWGLNGGTTVVTLPTYSYSGRPILFEFMTVQVGEQATADGAWYIGICEGSPPVTANVKLLGWGRAPQQGSGTFAYRFAPSGSHTYYVACWSGNGTGSDSVAVSTAYARVSERGS